MHGRACLSSRLLLTRRLRMSVTEIQPAPLAIRLLGRLQVHAADEAAIPLGGPKIQALFAYLAVRQGVPEHRDRLATLLWADRGQEQARHSLRQALLILRRALAAGGHDPIVTESAFVALDPAAIATDLARFEALGRSGDLDSMRQAERLYGGEFLDGIVVCSEPFAEWLDRERERLRGLACDILPRLARRLAAAGETEAATAAARRALAVDPALEECHRLLMEMLRATGQRAAALRQYQACVAALAREVGARPSAATQRLAEAIRDETAPPHAVAPAPAAASTVPAAPAGIALPPAAGATAPAPPAARRAILIMGLAVAAVLTWVVALFLLAR